MSDVETDAFTAIKARYSADTGAGGLAQSAGAARCQDFLRAGDRNQTPGYPHIVCHIRPTRMDSQGKDSYDLDITLEVVALFNEVFTQPDAAITRFETVFDNVEPAASASWNWSTLGRGDESTWVRRGDYRHKSVQYHMTATEV